MMLALVIHCDANGQESLDQGLRQDIEELPGQAEKTTAKVRIEWGLLPRAIAVDSPFPVALYLG